mmetsp:Transcript_41321/g.54304  ORF Transcript_41321/g.54304 Transcript_41321/m.54304 type:complete len:200 (+) Transcript_41321:41-640(+)
MDIPLMLPEDETEIHKEPVHVVLEKLNTSAEKGLTSSEASRTREVFGENILKKPVDCPSWLCCLLPCLGNVESNQYFGEVVPDDAMVMRGGRWVTIDASSLVRGDIVKIRAGESVAADMRIIECNRETKVDQSPITGSREEKVLAVDSDSDNFLDSANMIFTSSHITKGECKAVVVAVGTETVLHQLIQSKRWPPEMKG